METRNNVNIIYIVLMSFFVVSCSSQTETIEDKWNAYQSATTLVEKKIYASDLKVALDDKVDSDPKNLEALRMRASVKHYLGNTEGAYSDLKAVADINSNYVEYYWQRSNMGGGSADLKKIIEIDPHNVKAYFQLYYIAHESDQFIEAINFYTIALHEINKQNDKTWIVAEGKIYFERALSKDRINDQIGACIDIIKAGGYDENYYKDIYPRNCFPGPYLVLWPYGYLDPVKYLDRVKNASLPRNSSTTIPLIELEKRISRIVADPQLNKNLNNSRVVSIYWYRAKLRLLSGDYNPYSGTFFEKSLNYRGSHDLVKICSRRIK